MAVVNETTKSRENTRLTIKIIVKSKIYKVEKETRQLEKEEFIQEIYTNNNTRRRS